ncbi:NucA/NucB deoxyribonuclease domain-containing protein [Streptomyces barringtoniae]|uniref:NucA/NucB deoxyribonuclease domain-containing protein n=1 Tax=Streptomyces barringtoniae TaxID=2892029 RepID=UPI003FD8F9B8
MQRAGRTSCDEYPFASTYEGGTHLPASHREITGPRSTRTRPRADVSPRGAAGCTSWTTTPST